MTISTDPTGTRLSVNVNKIAVLRNSRGGGAPDVVEAARACIDAGAHGITVHPRPDARHINEADVHALSSLTRERGVEFNLEGNPFAPPRRGYPGFTALCEAVRPQQATLVPDGDGQLTSDHGFDFAADLAALGMHVAALKGLGCRVSLFVDGDPAAAARSAATGVEQAARVGADRIELYTGPYAEGFARGDGRDVLTSYVEVASRARAVGLGVNAGHDLSQANLATFLRALQCVEEVSIGHALISEALYGGLAPTVAAYLQILDAARMGRDPAAR